MRWLKQFFSDEPIDFQKRCKLRIGVSVFLFFLGLAAVALALAGDSVRPLYLSEDHFEFFPGFYNGIGFGMMAASLITFYKNFRYLKHPELRKKREIYETDERNRILGLRCWAYAGYSMFLLLYLGILVSAVISTFLTKVLLLIMALFGLLLLFFRRILNRLM